MKRRNPNPGGTMSPAEHDIVKNTVRYVAGLRPPADQVAIPTEPAQRFVEIGVWHADTSEVIYRELAMFHHRIHYIGVECDPAVKPHWDSKIPMHSNLMLAQLEIKKSLDALIELQGPVDWVLVDGCHCYDCAKEDMNAWGMKLAVGGLILVHDTIPKTKKRYHKLSQHFRRKPMRVIEALRDSILVSDLFVQVANWEVFGAGIRAYKRIKE